VPLAPRWLRGQPDYHFISAQRPAGSSGPEESIAGRAGCGGSRMKSAAACALENAEKIARLSSRNTLSQLWTYFA
jgi:hypothetical protein